MGLRICGGLLLAAALAVNGGAAAQRIVFFQAVLNALELIANAGVVTDLQRLLQDGNREAEIVVL